MTRWKVKLSNGEQYIEGSFPFEVLGGQKSPLLRLKEYLENNKISIVAIQILAGSKVFHFHGEENPRFNAFSDAPKAISYRFFRKIAQDLDGSGVVDHFAVIEATYSKHVSQIWVNEDDPNHCYVLTKDIE